MKHLNILNVLNKLYSVAIGTAGAAFLYFAYLGFQAGSLNAASGMMIPAIITLTIAAMYWMLGSNITIGKWRNGQIFAAILALPGFPLGTLYGAYALWVFYKDEESIKTYNELAAAEVF